MSNLGPGIGGIGGMIGGLFGGGAAAASLPATGTLMSGGVAADALPAAIALA